MSESKIDFEKFTQQERYDMLGQLLKLHAGAVKLDGTNNWCICLHSDAAAPGIVVSVCAVSHVKMRLRKLIILEPTIDVTEVERVFEDRIVGRWPRRRTVSLVARTIEHKRSAVLSRNSWEVLTLLNGQRLLLPTYGNVGGDMFGLQNDLVFDSMCEPGVGVTVTVRNRTKDPQPFTALMIGEAMLSPPVKSDPGTYVTMPMPGKDT